MNRALRNNNPGNIRISKTTWLGKIADNTDGSFEQFISIEYGLRAMYINIRTAIGKGYNTLNKLIPYWAPASDGNNTASYIAAVSKRSGISASQSITFNKQNIIAIAKAMFIVESGATTGITDTQYSKAFDMINDKTVISGLTKYIAPLLLFFYSLGCFTAPLIDVKQKNTFSYVTKNKKLLRTTKNNS